MVTFDLLSCMHTHTTTNPPWSRKPLDEDDAKNYRICTKTGMKVPKHMLATYMGKPYDKRYVPEGPDDSHRSYQ